jgi:putative nucleotidyltransferase with HDIG domain
MKAQLIDLNALVAQSNELPTLPQSTVHLANLLNSKQEVDHVASIVEIVTFDAALTFKLIRAANSAFAGSSQPVTNVKDAVVRLGTAQVFAIAVANSVRPHMQRNIPEYGFSDGAFWRHSVAAAVAMEVAQPFCTATVPHEAFTAALLHDIGKLIMARSLSQEILELLQQAGRDGGLTPLEAETRVLNVHHGEVGGLIAQHWQFPERITKGIIHHHAPEAGSDPICDLVYIANLAAKKVEAALETKVLDSQPDAAVFGRLGMSQDGFNKLCTAAVERFEQVRARYNVK